MMFECWLQLRGEAPDERRIASLDAGRQLALTHNLGGQPGQCVSHVSVVDTEPSSWPNAVGRKSRPETLFPTWDRSSTTSAEFESQFRARGQRSACRSVQSP
jgi:hypothetical protein